METTRIGRACLRRASRGCNAGGQRALSSDGSAVRNRGRIGAPCRRPPTKLRCGLAHACRRGTGRRRRRGEAWCGKQIVSKCIFWPPVLRSSPNCCAAWDFSIQLRCAPESAQPEREPGAAAISYRVPRRAWMDERVALCLGLSTWGYRRLPLHAVARVTRGVPAEEASATDAADGAAFRAWETQNGRTSFNPEPHGRRRLCGRRVATVGPLSRRDAPTRGARYETHRAEVAPNVLDYEAELVSTAASSRGRSTTAVAHRSARGRRDRSEQAPVRGRRSARGPRTGHRRLQGRQRDRRRDEGRASLLFHRLPARADAGPDHRGYRPRRGRVPRDSHRAAIPRPTASPASSAIARPAGRS